MKSKGINGKFILALKKALEPVKAAVNDIQGFEDFLYDYGWDITFQDTDIIAIQNYFNIGTTLDSTVNIVEDLQNGIGNEAELVADILNLLVDVIEFVREIGSNSIGNLPYPMDGSTTFWNDFPEDLINSLITDIITFELPLLSSTLQLFGVFEFNEIDLTGVTDRNTYLKHKVNWDKIEDLLIRPNDLLKNTYNWDHTTDPFDYKKAIINISTIFNLLRFAARIEEPTTPLVDTYYSFTNSDRDEIEIINIPLLLKLSSKLASYAELGVSIMPITPTGDVNAAPNGLMITPLVHGSISSNSNPGAPFLLFVSGEFDSAGVFTVEVRPDGINFVLDPSITDLNAKLLFSGVPDQPYLILGTRAATRLEVDAFLSGLEIRGPISETEIVIYLGTDLNDFQNKIRFVFEPNDGDNFINKIFGSAPQLLELSGAIHWSSKFGFGISGQAGFSISIPINKEVGPIGLKTLRIAAEAGSSIDPRVTFGLEVEAEIGPFTALVDNIGARVIFSEKGVGDEAGILGNLDFDWDFNPPKGIGLSIETDAIKGGGFLSFDFENERYLGALELSIKDKISLAVIGILTTKLPGNDDGYSLLLLITAEFQPVQLGFGFTINGVGGIIALNRTMNLEFLRDGVKAQTLDNILFPTDPVANINQIISDLEGAFPIEEGRYAFGPMGIIGWGSPTLITLEVGLMIEVPSPVRLALLGVLKAVLPTEEKALLQLQINFIGTIDFEAKYITFDASLYDSRLISFILSGDMAFRMKYGNDPIFLLSIGGFHPSFTPPPLDLPNLQRLTINLLGGNNPRLTLTTYFAITSNTVQFGAAIDFYFKVTKNIKVIGFLGFDILIQFNPFYLIANISAGLAVIRKNKTLFGIFLSGELRGPSPWHAKGTAKFKVLGIKLKAKFDKQFGKPEITTLPDIEVLPLLEEALKDKANWIAEAPPRAHLLVNIREVEASNNEIVVHPNGKLAVSQKVVPLDLTIKRFGTQRPSDYNKFSLDLYDSNNNQLAEEDIKEYFAPAEYLELTSTQKLSRKSFEKMNGGIKIQGGDELNSSFFMERQVAYEQIIVDSRHNPIRVQELLEESAVPFQGWVQNNATAKSNLGSKRKPISYNAPPKVQLQQEEYAIANLEDLSLYNGMQVGSEVEANVLLEELIEQNPALEPRLQVVPAFELV